MPTFPCHPSGSSAASIHHQPFHGRAATRILLFVADDETAEVVEVLVDLLAIPGLGTDDTGVRRRLVALIGANRIACTSRARAKLRGIIPDLDEDLRTRLDWA